MHGLGTFADYADAFPYVALISEPPDSAGPSPRKLTLVVAYDRTRSINSNTLAAQALSKEKAVSAVPECMLAKMSQISWGCRN